MNPEPSFDAIVFGSGPAGATVARILAARGHRVGIVQRGSPLAPHGPRWETLSPGALELLRLHHPDVWTEIEQRLVRCRASVLWTRDDDRSSAVHPATMIDRHVLDPILLTSATAVGAVPIPRDSVPASRFVIDAAGRSAAFPAPRALLGEPTLALTAGVAGAALPARSTRVESLAEGWLWAGRGDEAEAVATLFVSPRLVRGWPHGEHAARFLETLRASSLVREGRESRLVSKVTARESTPAERPPPDDGKLLRAGDAAVALDPLSGQGLQNAFVSAAQASTAVHTMLVRIESAGLVHAFLHARHAEAAREHASACATFYRSQDRHAGAFWRERADGSPSPPTAAPTAGIASLDLARRGPFSLSRESRWKSVPVIVGEFIDRAQALDHPSLARPIAYLEGRPIAELLAALPETVTLSALVHAWAERTSLREAASLRALNFLLHHGVLLTA